MREHQIVITLKPEQFLEVQRMARISGAKSMGMFVRQRLLSALGIDSQLLPAGQKPTGAPDINKISGDLRRLHGELKIFVSESLANTYIGPPPDNNHQLISVEASDLQLESGFLPAAAPGEPISVADLDETMAVFEQARDELEQMAQRAFAISPRLGPIADFEGSEPKPESEEQTEDLPKAPRDPLDELLEDPLMTRIDDYLSRARRQSAELATEITDEEPLTDSAGEAEEDEIFDVPLPLTDRPAKLTEQAKKVEEQPPEPQTSQPPPPPGRSSGNPPGGISGGPPPRRRQ
jgi:hypothetical protein